SDKGISSDGGANSDKGRRSEGGDTADTGSGSEGGDSSDTGSGSEGGDKDPGYTTGISGSEVVNFALSFVGNPYVWGGKDPNTGADCSGFTSYVYAHFGISVPSYSYSQRSVGTEVSYANARAGDLICYAGHVAIYMGNGQIVHAKGTAYGIVAYDNATYRPIITVRRLL
ncbi:MAG: C40 family peptidase, partial [Lachnospiraceae bacterium]